MRWLNPVLKNDNSTIPAAWRDRIIFLGYYLLLMFAWLFCKSFEIEQAYNFSHLFLITIIASFLSFFIPVHYRQIFQVFLTLLAPFLLFPWKSALSIDLTLIVFTALLIANIPFKIKLTLTVILTALAGGLFAYGTKLFPEASTLGITSTFFMFRAIIYLHEESNGLVKESIIERAAYFLLLPNLSAPLFPIVNYKSYVKGYFSLPANDILAKATLSIFKGLIQIWIYRLLYHLVLPDFPSHGNDASTMILYLFTNFILVYRVVGLFHLTTGLVMLFGYDLPYLFNHFLFGTGFSDLWKRINIRWREDLMTKVFYYPLYFRLKKKNMMIAMLVSTFACFIISWILHSWQWFWLRGDFPLTLIDGIFWTTFGILVTANTYLLNRRINSASNRRTKSWKLILINSLKGFGVFCLMSVLWSLWTSSTFSIWLTLFSDLSLPGTTQLLKICGFIGIYFFCALTYFSVIDQETRIIVLPFSKPSHWIIPAFIALMLVFTLKTKVFRRVVHQFEKLRYISVTTSENLNHFDKELMTNGYYDKISQANNFTSPIWDLEQTTPKNWGSFGRSGIAELRKDILIRSLIPNTSDRFKNVLFTINSRGMRDREYSINKSTDELRIGIFGASVEVGEGVDSSKVFKYLLEKEFEKNYLVISDSTPKHLQMLNYSVSGYKPLQYLPRLEWDALPAKLDYAFFFFHNRLKERDKTNILNLLKRKCDFKYPFLVKTIHDCGLDKPCTPEQLRERITRANNIITPWLYTSMVSTCRKNNIIPVWVYSVALSDNELPASHGPEVELQRELATKYGFVFLDLNTAYDDYNKKDLQIAEWDLHPNELGHQCLANELLKAMIENQNSLHLTLKRK